jgi:hypothetical protein
LAIRRYHPLKGSSSNLFLAKPIPSDRTGPANRISDNDLTDADPVIVHIAGYGLTDTHYFDPANDPRSRKAQ